MALARKYDADRNAVVITLLDSYKDRLSRWSDIQEYLPFFYNETKSRPGCRVLELGTRKGNSTMAFLAGAAEADGHVWSCDITNVAADPDAMMAWAGSSRWTFIQGDDRDGSVLARLPGEVDILFIDTSHEYDHTMEELGLYMPRVAPGGIALFHDTNLMYWPGYDWHEARSPVWKALDDYSDKVGLTWENLEGEYGLGVIRIDGKRETS